MTVWWMSSNQHRNTGVDGYLEQAWAQQTTNYAVKRLHTQGVVTENVFVPGAGAASTDELARMVAKVNKDGRPGDVVLSIHSNAAAGYSLGILPLVYSSLTQGMGEKVARRTAEILRLPYVPIRFRPDLAVLNGTPYPSVLLEVNAHDTREGAEYNLAHSEEIGRAIADAYLYARGQEPKPEPEPGPQAGFSADDRARLARSLSRSLSNNYDLKLIKCFLRGDSAARLNALEVEKLASVNAERAGLGLESAESTFVWGAEPPPPPPTPPGVTLETPVAGTVDLTVSELAARLPGDAIYNRPIVAGAYQNWCRVFGLRLDVAWCQMILETNGLRYGGAVDPVRYPFNFCGLKDTSGSGWAEFRSLEAGVIAHCAHLAAYVFPAHVRTECSRACDPRHPDSHIEFQKAHGTVRTVGDLGSGAWAEDTEYAEKLVRVWERGA